MYCDRICSDCEEIGCQDREDDKPATTPEIPACEWHQEDWDCDIWQTDCGEAFILNDEGPHENNMKFCCYCGKPLKPIKREEEGD